MVATLETLLWVSPVIPMMYMYYSLVPSIYALQNMLCICTSYGHYFKVIYKAKKTVCIWFTRDKDVKDCNAILNSIRLNCVPHVKYLGIILTRDLSSGMEMAQRRYEFIRKVNHVLSQYHSFT